MTLTLNRQLLTSRQILVAFSGGLDSTVLLHQLVQWRTENPGVTLRAIHVHHGLSANADAWVTHCENVCQQWQVPLVVERVQLAQEGLGIEAQARQARYQAFARTLLPGEVLVTAQHLDDQCETFLLALKRGSGPAGLSAMAEVSEFAGTRLIRPLLARTRGELAQWALAHGLRWIEDESNQDDSYDRNCKPEEKEKALKTKCNSIMPTIQRICVSGCIACDNKNCSPPPVRLNSAIEIRKAIKSKYNIFTYSGCLIAG